MPSLRKDAQGNDLEIKSFSFEIKECKQLESNPSIGVISGYASTFGNLDRGDDIVAAGAFDRTIMEHRKRGNRSIRFYANHRSEHIIGGLPIDLVKPDNVGLFVVAHLDLNVAKAAEQYSLAKNRFISDFSIGFSLFKFERNEETGIRTLLEIDLYEVSLVSEPMNQLSVVLDVDGKRSHKPNYKPKEGSSMATETGKNGESDKGLTIYTDDKGKKIGVDADGNIVAVPQEKTFAVADVESLQSPADVEEQLKQAGYSQEARKALMRKIKEFGSKGREDLKDDDGREGQSTNGREAEDAKVLLDSLSGLSNSLKPKVEDKDNG